jgi:serine/threonine-protein kinase HipA
MDRYAVLWTRAMGQPKKLADMLLNDQQLRITKTDEAMEQGIPGMSMLHDLARQQHIIYERAETHRLPPQLQALLPPRDNNNPQRLILGKSLAREINVAGMKPLDQEWHMLTFAGHGGIGHLDVFKTDELARQYYYAQPDMHALDAKTGAVVWSAFRRLALDIANEQDENLVLDAIGWVFWPIVTAHSGLS